MAIVGIGSAADVDTATSLVTALNAATAALTAATAASLQKSNNLSDVTSASTARTNLGLDSTYARLAPDWAARQTVAAGELRVYGGTLYRRIAAGTTGASFIAANWMQVDQPGAPAAVPVVCGASDMEATTGSPTRSNTAWWPYYTLIDGSTTGVSMVPGLTPGVDYDAFVRWAPSGTGGGNFTLGWGTDQLTEGSAAVAESTRFFYVPGGGTALQVFRTHIQETLSVPAGAGSNMVFRIQRAGSDSADTNTGNFLLFAVEFIPRLPIADAATADGGTLTPTVWATPYNGSTVRRSASAYTPLWTTATGIFVAEPVTIGGTQQSRLAKVNRTTKATVQDVQLATGTHDTIIGHRQASVAVTAAGVVVAHPEGHHAPWAGKHSTSSEDLTTLTSTTTPTGLDVNCSYRRFFRNPYNGDIWMASRANTYFGGIYKWNPGGSTWTQVGGNYFSAQGMYGGHVAFASATTVYATTEWFQNSGVFSGYPRRSAAVVKSTDGGSTWTTMTGAPLVAPIPYSAEGRHAFPAAKGIYTVAGLLVAVTSDGNPLVVASWRHPSDTYRSLWAAKWNSTTKSWDRTRLLANGGANATGNPTMVYTAAGRVIVCVAPTDNHTTGDDGIGAEVVPTAQNHYLFVTDDALSWTRYTIAGSVSSGGASLDSEAYRLDGIVRMMPFDEANPTTSAVWDVTLPA